MNAVKFSAKSSEVKDILKLELSGYIDENSTFPDIQNCKKRAIEIDLGGIKSLNSLGIRGWIKWINGNPGVSFVFENCPKVVVDHCNMISNFLPKKSSVKSFYIPYYSQESGEERNVLLRYGVDYDDKEVRTPKDIVDSLNNPMDIEFVESKYYKFLFSK